MVNKQCLKLLTNYDLVKKAYLKNQTSVLGIYYDEAVDMCSDTGGSIAVLYQETFHMFHTYLKLWRHNKVTGDILVKSSNSSGLCTIILVSTYSLLFISLSKPATVLGCVALYCYVDQQ